MENNIEDVDLVSDSLSTEEDFMSDSSSDAYQDEYGELFILDNPIPLSEYLKDWVSLEVPQDPQVISKLDQYVVTHACDGLFQLFGVRNRDGDRYFAKYDVQELYETEKRSHEVLDPLNCPSIIKMVDAIPIGEGGIIMVPMYNRYSNDPLSRHIQLVMKKLLEAIKLCHDNGIAHRDIKPQNIVWRFADPGRCKILEIFLTDFGLACFDFEEYENMTIETIPGTLRYYSPEKLMGLIPPDPRVCDIFAAGVVFLELAMQTTKPAFKYGTLAEIFNVTFNFEEVVGHLLLPHTADLLKKMLDIDYSQRITVNEALEHQFFREKYATRMQYAVAHKIVGKAGGFLYKPEFLTQYKLNIN